MSLINTRFNAFRAASPMDKWETRANRWGFLEMFKNQTMDPINSIITPDLQAKAIAAAGSSLEVPVIDFDSGVSILNQTIPVTVTGSPSTSQMMAITFTHYYWAFLIHPAQHFNNEISMQREFNAQSQKYIFEFMDTLDQACAARLEADKTQVLADTLGGRYALVSDVIEAPLAEETAAIGDINPLMGGNKFYGPFDMVANGSMESLVRNKLMEKGQFQTDDKRYQYNDKNWYFSNNLANAGTHKATAFIVQQGSCGLLQQFAPDCVMRNRTHKHLWDIERLPIADMNVGVYQYDDAVNGSALSGAATALLTSTKAEAYAFHTAIATLTTYNSDRTTIASPIAKLGVLAA